MLTSITLREQEILHCIASELTSKEIGERLFISAHTVISHRKNLQSKLNVRNTAGLVRRGFECGILLVSDDKSNLDIATFQSQSN